MSQDPKWEGLSPAGRAMFLRRSAEAIQLIAAGLAHMLREDGAAAEQVMSRLAPDPASAAMNYMAFSPGLALHTAKRLGVSPADLMEELAQEGALMRLLADENGGTTA